MPFELDNYDIAILKVLMKDGRKSFRQISRETGITTPTVRSNMYETSLSALLKDIPQAYSAK